MQDSVALIAPMVRDFEGCSLKPYLCPAGIWTIGYGNTVLGNGKPVTKLTPAITQQEAETLLVETLQSVQTQVRQVVTRMITPPQEAALISFTHNLGIGRLAGSTLLKKLNAGDYQGAAREFPRWNKSGGRVLPGLTRRRAAEQKLFLEGIKQ